MTAYSQANRSIRVDTALGPDALLLNGFRGSEAISRPFRFELDLLSETSDLSADEILGTPVVLSVLQQGGAERKIHGIVRSFAQTDRHQGLAAYRADVVPWFWFLSLSTDCRVFQEMTVPEIVEQVFGDFGHTDFSWQLTRSYDEREYCVQYRESHLDFVSRLLESEGIFYYFEHTSEGHVLVLADSNTGLDPCPGMDEIPLKSQTPFAEDHISKFEQKQSVFSGAVSTTDYDYLQPPLSLDASLSGAGTGEVFDYQPRRYTRQDQGERITRVLLEQREVRRHVVAGSGICRHLQSGFTFELTGHYRDDANRAYLLTEVIHEVSGSSFTTWDTHRHEHKVEFVAIPFDIPYRPAAVTPRPRMFGAQTAEVVGKADEEIWCDEHGRIKVQFHWDRYGEKDEHSSCWVRVASRWAGKGWGEIHLPRIGQEVVVDFLEGNPDAPLVTGAVYNDDQPPPWDLPGAQTRSGMKSRSSKGGGGWNEVSIDDRKGAEMVTIHGQRNMNTRVEHDQQSSIGNDRSVVVGNDESITVGRNRDITIGGARTETVSGDTELIVADGNRTQTVANGRSSEIVAGDREVIVDGASSHIVRKDVDVSVAEGDLTLAVGSGTATVDGAAGVRVVSAADVKIEGANVAASGAVNVQVDGTVIKLTGKTEITLGVGANFVKIDPTGVTIFGTMVKIN